MPRHAGFTMMSMLFILVALAALGAALASLSQRQHLGSAGELAAAKAYQAAFAGLELASSELLRPASAPACFANRNVVMPDQLSDFTVTLTCSRTPSSGTVSDGDASLVFYQVVATACNAPSSGTCPATGTLQATYTERQLSRSLSR